MTKTTQLIWNYDKTDQTDFLQIDANKSGAVLIYVPTK